MSETGDSMDRRRFHRLCGGLVAGAATLHALPRTAAGNGAGRDGAPWPRSRLVTAAGTPLSIADLAPGDAFVFSYPYRTTPCFLLRLETAAAPGDGWPGGLGPDRSVVAFSAICSHKMTHPARPISHISYRPDTVRYRDNARREKTARGVISCCSERSVYDPAAGGAVLGGPARAPLAAIALEQDGSGALAAHGSHGPDQYERFLEQFGFRLAMEYGVTDVRARAGRTTVAEPAERFSAQQIRC